MRKLETGLIVIESFADMEELYAKRELDGVKMAIVNMAGKRIKYCLSNEFWQTLRNKIEFRSDDRSILCNFNNELVKISYSDPRCMMLFITVEKVKVYEVKELE